MYIATQHIEFIKGEVHIKFALILRMYLKCLQTYLDKNEIEIKQPQLQTVLVIIACIENNIPILNTSKMPMLTTDDFKNDLNDDLYQLMKFYFSSKNVSINLREDVDDIPYQYQPFSCLVDNYKNMMKHIDLSPVAVQYTMNRGIERSQKYRIFKFAKDNLTDKNISEIKLRGGYKKFLSGPDSFKRFKETVKNNKEAVAQAIMKCGDIPNILRECEAQHSKKAMSFNIENCFFVDSFIKSLSQKMNNLFGGSHGDADIALSTTSLYIDNVLSSDVLYTFNPKNPNEHVSGLTAIETETVEMVTTTHTPTRILQSLSTNLETEMTEGVATSEQTSDWMEEESYPDTTTTSPQHSSTRGEFFSPAQPPSMQQAGDVKRKMDLNFILNP